MTKIVDTNFKGSATKTVLGVSSLAAGDLVPVYDVSAGFYKMVAISDFATDTEDTATKIASLGSMAPGAAFKGTGTIYKSSVSRVGDLITTQIFIDLTGASSVATDKDIIGTAGVCHIGQITTAINGVVYGGQVQCLEVPATGADDIDLYMASVGTGAYDAAGSGLTDAASLVTKAGAWGIGAPTVLESAITADYYLYLLSGEAVAGEYSAGQILITLYGIAA